MALDVLVVDDSDIIRSMVKKTLRLAELPLGNVYEAANGREALDVLDGNWVDLVLADLNMPVMDGIEMVDRMKASRDIAGIPVIVISTEGNAKRIEEMRSKGVAEFIRKPFTPESIRDAVCRVTTDWSRDDHGELVAEVFRTVLERFTFMYGEPVDKEHLPAPDGDLLYARMTFSGLIEGAMGLAAPLELCREMSRNVLGVDHDDGTSPNTEIDALGEVLNMACGHVATALEADVAADLAPPVVGRMADEHWSRVLATPSTFAFLVEEMPALLSLDVRRRV